MDKKKNIIYITWRDSYGIDVETRRFVDAFRLRQDANNIDTYRIDEIRDWREVTQNMQTMGIFVEKRLFVFSGNLRKELSRNGEPSKAEKKNSEAEKMLLWICESITDDTFLIFSWVTMDTKSPLALWLKDNADIRTYDTLWDIASWQSRYSILDNEEVKVIITKYKQSEDGIGESEIPISYAISQSLEKLALIRESRLLTPSDYEESLFLESTGKMYDFSDAIMRADASRALRIFHLLLESMNIHAFLASFMWLMRTSIYIKYYKSLWKTQSEIATLVTAHPYVIQKSYESRIEYRDLFDFYEKILWLNTAYRSGKWRKDPELWLIFDIELAIMGLKK